MEFPYPSPMDRHVAHEAVPTYNDDWVDAHNISFAVPWETQWTAFDSTSPYVESHGEYEPAVSEYTNPWPLSSGLASNATAPSATEYVSTTDYAPFPLDQTIHFQATIEPGQRSSILPQTPAGDEQPAPKKRKRTSRGGSTTSRRASMKDLTAYKGHEASRKRSTSQEDSAPHTESCKSSPQHDEEHIKRIQARNRVASNKFRVKKKEDAARLKIDEQEMGRISRRLSSCVADLTLEVYNLKMQILQHTDCKCTLIQDYIAHEAKQYIAKIDDMDDPAGWT